MRTSDKARLKLAQNRRRRGAKGLLAALGLAALTPMSHAATYWWDSDGATAGFGNTTGTWGTSAFWSTDATGQSATANTTITTSDDVNFGAATLNYGNATVTGPGTAQGFSSMTFGAGQTTALTLSGGTLNLNAAGSTITQNSASTMRIGSVLAGSGATLTKNGAGTLTLSGINTYTGTTTINAGTIKTGGVSATKYIAGDIVINSGGTLDLGTVSASFNQLGAPVGNAPTNTVTVNSGGTLSWANTVETFNNLTLNSKTLTLNGGHSTGWGSLVVLNTLTATGTSAINVGTGSFNAMSPGNGGAKTLNVAVTNSGDSFTIAPVIQNYDGTNTYALTKSGAGLLTLTGANTYTGGTTVNAGTLTIGATGSVGAGGMTVTGSSSVLNVNGSYTNTSGATGVSVAGGGTVNLSGTATIGGSNTGAILIGNGGVGTFNVTSGSLTSSFTNGNGFGIGWGAGGDGTLNVSGGTVATSNSSLFYVGIGASNAVGNVNVSGTGTLNIGANSGRIFIGGSSTGSAPFGTGTLTISGNGSVSFAAGTVTLGNYAYLGAYGGGGTINLDGGTLSTARPIIGRASTTTFAFNGGTLRAGGNTTLLGPDGSLIAANGTSTFFLAQANVKAGGAILDSNGFNANITQPLLAAGGGVTKIGAGTIVLDGANTYTGGTTVSAGTLKVSGTLAAATGTVNVSASGTMDLSGTSQTTGPVTLGGGTIFKGFLNASSVSATGGSISTALNGSGGLSKSSAGTLTLSGASTYTGGTTLSDGTLVVGGSSTTGTNIPAGYKIAAVGDSITAGSTTNWPAVLQSQIRSRMGNNNVTVTNFGNSGSTAIYQLGNIGPAHPYTGTATYTNALNSDPHAVVIQLGTNDSIATSAQIQQYYAADLTTIINAFKATDNNPAIYLALPPVIYSTGAQNEGRLTADVIPLIQQVAAATGATVIDNHTMTLNESTLYPDGLHPGAQGLTLLGTNIYASLASTYFQNGPLGTGTVTLSGGTLSDDGTARTLHNSLDITGNVTFASTGGGSLTFDPAGLGSTVTISNSPTLTVSNTTTIKQVVGGTGFTKAGNGTLILTADNTYASDTTITGGTLLANNTAGSATGAGAVAVNSGGTLGGGGFISGDVSVNSGGTIAPGNGVGTLTTGDQTWAGGGTYVWELGDIADPSADSDLLDGATLTITANPQATPTPTAPFEIEIVRAAGEATPHADNWFTIAHVDEITGGLGAFDAQDFLLTDVQGGQWEIEAVAVTDGFDIRVSPAAVPEPASAAVLALAAGAMALRRRRCRHA